MERRNDTSGGGRADEAARFERADDAGGHLVEGPRPVDLVDDSARAVYAEDRGGLALVDRETVRDDLFGVVGAALFLRAPREASDALLSRHAELDDGVEGLAASFEEGVEVAHLRDVARIPVEQEAARGVLLLEALAHDLARQLVGDELACLDDGLHLTAQLGAG